jgi:hypothetical protein
MARQRIGKLMPTGKLTQYRCPVEEPNLMSVAIHVEIGEIRMLLGADLEHSPDVRRGWTAVLSDLSLPKSRSMIFKIPHHGGLSSFSERIWMELLEDSVLAATTPWAKGGRFLPSDADQERIVARTPNAFLTSPPQLTRSRVARGAAVASKLREMNIRLFQKESKLGAVRFRNGGSQDWNSWNIRLYPPAAGLPISQ